jgi:hypothetical protein
MPDTGTITAIIRASDALMPVTLITIWLALRRAGASPNVLQIFGVFLLVALVWGAIWTWVPSVAALRLLPPPSGQAGAILSALAGCLALMLIPAIRIFLRTAQLQWLVPLGIWRAVYGSVLLILGILGGLPPAFFWSAAAGDIFVGLWALLITVRKLQLTQRELIAWNLIGMADLAHVLPLGALNLGLFYATNPGVQPLNLLPLVGVPIFLALQIMSLWGLLVSTPISSSSAAKIRD